MGHQTMGPQDFRRLRELGKGRLGCQAEVGSDLLEGPAAEERNLQNQAWRDSM